MTTQVNIQESMRTVDLIVTLRGLRQLRCRLWLGMMFLRLGAFVVGCGIKIDDGTREAREV